MSKSESRPDPQSTSIVCRLASNLHSSDVLVIAFASLLSLVNIFFSTSIVHWRELVLINCSVICAVLMLGYARATTKSKTVRLIHDWYLPPMVFFSFKELYYMIKPIHFGRDYDDVLMAIDRWVFGVNPTEWLMQFANPWVTEILQIAYTSFYFLFLVLGYELYRRHNLDTFHYFMFTCVYGFFLSYLGYFFLPAVGPRFTLHDFAALNHDLPGVWLTPYLRWFVNAGGSVPMGVPNDVALAGTQRDVFPSGHTMMTVALMYLSTTCKAKTRYFIYVIGALLIVATVYQRYHYVVDLVAGSLFAAVCVLTSRSLYFLVKHRFQTLESRLESSQK